MSNSDRALVAIVAELGVVCAAALVVYWRQDRRAERTAALVDPDRVADAMLDAIERRELMRDAAREESPPEA